MLSLCNTGHFILYYRLSYHARIPRKAEKTLKMAASQPFFISTKFVIGYPCVRPYICFHILGPAILHSFELCNYYKITQI